MFRNHHRRYGEEDGEEVGGFVRNRPKNKEKGKEEEMKGKSKMTSVGGLEALRNPKVRTEILGENAPASVTPAPTTPAPATKPAPAPATATTTPLPETEPCPLCGWLKATKITPQGGGESYRPLTCKGERDKYNAYAKEVAGQLAAGEQVEVLSWHQWVLKEMDLASFGLELGDAFRERNRLDALVQAELKAKGNLPKQVFNSLRETLQLKLYPGETVTARAAYNKWRRFQARLEAAKVVRPEVARMVADEAARNAPPPAAPPEKKAKATRKSAKATANTGKGK